MVQGTRANSLTGTCSDPHRPGSQRSGQVLLGPQGWRPPAPSRGEPGWTGRLQMTGPGTVLPLQPWVSRPCRTRAEGEAAFRQDSGTC